jgi:glutathione S-transferase
MLACFGGVGLLAMVGHAQFGNVATREDPIQAPAWVTLPERGEVLSIALDGGPGNEASLGYIDVAVADEADQILSLLKTRLAAKGYLVENAMTGADVLFGASDMIVASDPATGRKMRFIELNTPAGPVLRVFFSDPAPEFARAGT